MNNFMKQFIIFIILSWVLCSCVTVGFALNNEDGSSTDVCEAVPIPGIDTSLTARKTALAEFGFTANYDDRLHYSSPEPRLKYCFKVIARIEPTVKLNSFSFTDAKGDTIPSVLYCRTKNRGVYIIDTLPIVLTDEIVKEKGMYGPTIIAECSHSCKSIKKLYVNYDIEVGDTHYVKSIKYKRKWFLDIRPQIW